MSLSGLFKDLSRLGVREKEGKAGGGDSTVSCDRAR